MEDKEYQKLVKKSRQRQIKNRWCLWDHFIDPSNFRAYFSERVSCGTISRRESSRTP